MKASFAMSTHQMVRLLTRSTTSKFSMCCEMQCCTGDLHHGSEVTGSFPVTNAPAHSSHLVQNFLDNQIPQVLHSPYSPEMALCDFFLFPKVKMLLKGNRFQDSVEIKQRAMTRLLAIPKSQFQ